MAIKFTPKTVGPEADAKGQSEKRHRAEEQRGLQR